MEGIIVLEKFQKCYNAFMEVCCLASGSHGNSTFLSTGLTNILIDCGLCLKDIESKLYMIKKEPKNINAIFITHEHKDHISGIVAFVKKYNCLVFLHDKIFSECSFMFAQILSNVKIFGTNDFYFQDLTVSPFELIHDSVFCVGFSFYCQGKKVSIATDTGILPKQALMAMQGSDLALIEANHDVKMLIYGPYNARLKKRIASDEGHLSNEDAAKIIVELARMGTRKFVLCHLSLENNTEKIALFTVNNALIEAGYEGIVECAQQYNITKIFNL